MGSHAIHLCAALCLFLSWAARTVDAKESPATQGPQPPFTLEGKKKDLPRHSGKYPPVRVAWRPARRLKDIAAVYPHPLLPRRVVVATSSGLQRSDDAAGSWQDLPSAATSRVGSARGLAFLPNEPDTFYLASGSQGVWVTSDNGQTFRQVGSKANGLASDVTTSVYVYPFDRRSATLLATHDEAAPGISLSRAGGRTWRVFASRYYARSLLFDSPSGRRTHYVTGSEVMNPGRRSIYSGSTLGAHWYEVIRDVIPTGGATRVLHRNSTLWATADAGLFAISHYGAKQSEIGPKDVDTWSGVGVTWGAHADEEIIYAYEPTKLGMLVSRDNLTTTSAQSRGLYTGPYIKEGSHIRANANGTIFYAVVNDVLYVGHTRGGAFKISNVTVDPPVLSYAPQTLSNSLSRLRGLTRDFVKERHAVDAARRLLTSRRQVRESFPEDREVTVTAAVVGPRGKPARVTIDLSRLGGSCRTPMFDDGKHRDGAAGDGVFGVAFSVARSCLRSREGEWRRRLPGYVGLTVTAVSDEGRLSGAVALLYLHARAESFVFWTDDPYRFKCFDPQGNVSFAHDTDLGDVHSGWRSLRFTVGSGPWVAPWGSHWFQADIAGHYALSFWVKTDGDPHEELYCYLRDSSWDLYPETTRPVPIMEEGYVEGGVIDGTFRRVVLPIQRLIRDAPAYRPSLTSWVMLSGDSREPRNYWIDDIRFVLDKQDLESSQ